MLSAPKNDHAELKFKQVVNTCKPTSCQDMSKCGSAVSSATNCELDVLPGFECENPKFVLDEVEKACVKPNQCKCVYDGVSYDKGTVIAPYGVLHMFVALSNHTIHNL